MRVLIVAWYFPPAGGGGVQRVLAWCRHLPALGIEVDVLVPRDPRWVQHDPTLEVPASVHVIRSSAPVPRAVLPRTELARRRGIARMVRRVLLQPRRLLLPDLHVGWRLTAPRAAMRDARARGASWDVVLSTSPPETCHLVGAAIARRCGVPWVADFRDSWLDLPHLRTTRRSVRWKHRANVTLATRVLRRARAAITVSEPLATDLRRRHPGLAVHVVENGVDLASVEAVAPAAHRCIGSRRGAFTVTCTGNFFGRQTPRTMLDAVEALVARRPEAARYLRLRLVGELKALDVERIARAPLCDVVHHAPFLPHVDALAEQQAADLLFLYIASGPGSAGVFTGKVFEYLAARRPVLALVPDGNVARKLISQSGAGTSVDPDDAVAVAVQLEAALDRWIHADGPDGGRTPDLQLDDTVAERISRDAQVRQLADVLRRLMRRSADGG